MGAADGRARDRDGAKASVASEVVAVSRLWWCSSREDFRMARTLLLGECLGDTGGGVHTMEGRGQARGSALAEGVC